MCIKYFEHSNYFCGGMLWAPVPEGIICRNAPSPGGKFSMRASKYCILFSSPSIHWVLRADPIVAHRQAESVVWWVAGVPCKELGSMYIWSSRRR